jgi:hypothetical protein
VGKWIEEEFFLNDFSVHTDGVHATFEPERLQYPYVLAEFDKRWEKHLNHREVRERLRIRGKISHLSWFEISLEKCAVVET